MIKNNVVKMELSEEAMIMEFEAQQKIYKKKLIRNTILAGFGLIMCVFGIFFFNFVLLSGVMKSWLSSY